MKNIIRNITAPILALSSFAQSEESIVYSPDITGEIVGLPPLPDPALVGRMQEIVDRYFENVAVNSASLSEKPFLKSLFPQGELYRCNVALNPNSDELTLIALGHMEIFLHGNIEILLDSNINETYFVDFLSKMNLLSSTSEDAIKIGKIYAEIFGLELQSEPTAQFHEEQREFELLLRKEPINSRLFLEIGEGGDVLKIRKNT